MLLEIKVVKDREASTTTRFFSQAGEEIKARARKASQGRRQRLRLRASCGCASPLPDAVHQVGVPVEEDSVAPIVHGHQAPAPGPVVSP